MSDSRLIYRVVARHIRQALAEIDAALGIDEERLAESRHVTVPAHWELLEERAGESYTWPDSTDHYKRFVIYQSGSLVLAAGLGARGAVLGKSRRVVVIFLLGKGRGSKRPIVPFVEADDASETDEMVALIRGNGSTGKAMFSPSDSLPEEYQHFKLDNYGQRIHHGFNRLCVVAKSDDVQTMLAHAALQVILRRMPVDLA